MAEIQMLSMWTKIASNLKSVKNKNLPSLLFEKMLFTCQFLMIAWTLHLLSFLYAPHFDSWY